MGLRGGGGGGGERESRGKFLEPQTEIKSVVTLKCSRQSFKNYHTSIEFHVSSES